MPAAKYPKLTADTASGQILLALRAGRMSLEAMQTRFGGCYQRGQLNRLLNAGLVAKIGDGAAVYYHLTEAGKQACPTRRGINKPNRASLAAHP